MTMSTVSCVLQYGGLCREFEDKIGFHFRPRMNHSDLLAYDTSGSGSYVEAALSSIGVSSEQPVHNVAIRLRDDINSVQLVPWPHRARGLVRRRTNSRLSRCSCYLVCGVRRGYICLPAHSLTSIITQYVTK